MPFPRAAGNRAPISLDGRRYVLDPPTTALLDALAAGRLAAVFPGSVRGAADRAELFARLFDPADPFDVGHVETITAAYVHTVTGHALPAAMRLAAALEQTWQVSDGAATAEGIDLLALPARRVLNWLYARAVEAAEYDERDRPGARARLDRDLRAPLDPPDLPRLDAWVPVDRLPPTDTPDTPATPATPAPVAARVMVPAGFSPAEQAAGFRAAMAALGAAGS